MSDIIEWAATAVYLNYFRYIFSYDIAVQMPVYIEFEPTLKLASMDGDVTDNDTLLRINSIGINVVEVGCVIF